MSQTITSSYPTTSYFDWTGIDMGVALLYLFIFSFSCKVLLQGGPFALEFISIVSQPSFCLCLFYRPPSSPVSVFDNLCTTLHIVNSADFSSFLLIGDFNVNFCNTDHFLFSHVQDVMLRFSLTQVASSHTYISPSDTPSLHLAMLTNS